MSVPNQNPHGCCGGCPCDTATATMTLSGMISNNACFDCFNLFTSGTMGNTDECQWDTGPQTLCVSTVTAFIRLKWESGTGWTLKVIDIDGTTVYATYTFSTFTCSGLNTATYVSSANNWCAWSTAVFYVTAS